MLRRIALIIALAAVAAPATGQANEWEEDYTDDWAGEPSSPDPADVDVDVSVTFDTFHGALSPYGQWVVVGSYGRVWRPHVAAGWRPYYNGRWEWTNEGWLWVSDEPWGWAAYHYGRWALDSHHGWIWVPGYQWAPAWVSWRYSGDVVGWAPLAPGVSVYVSVTSFHDHWWTFVPCHSFVGHPVHHVAYRPSFTRRYWHATAPAPAYRGRPARGHAVSPAWGGPPHRTVEHRIGRPLHPVRVVPAPSPGRARVGRGEVAMYRPGLRGWNGARHQAPRAGARDGVRSSPRFGDDARTPPSFRRDDARTPGFRRDDARPGSGSRDGQSRPRFGDGGGRDRDFIGDVRAHNQGRQWNQADRSSRSEFRRGGDGGAPRAAAPRVERGDRGGGDRSRGDRGGGDRRGRR